ncbi:MAG: ABC transporter substrate-binding protein [Alphaproteobacteria bacterium]|nr:ABC transporter substrate-binding protein [Alphaproteobacteria bacterium]
MKFIFSRRTFLAASTAFIATAAAAPMALASTAKAQEQTEKLFADMLNAVNLAKDQRTQSFRSILGRYGNPSSMAGYALGPLRRVFTPAQQRQFTPAFQTYLARKYGKNLSQLGIQSLEIVKTEEKSKRGKAYFIVHGKISTRKYGKVLAKFFLDKRGRHLKFYDLHIEHRGMLIAERNEMGTLFDQNQRNFNKFLQALS